MLAENSSDTKHATSAMFNKLAFNSRHLTRPNNQPTSLYSKLNRAEAQSSRSLACSQMCSTQMSLRATLFSVHLQTLKCMSLTCTKSCKYFHVHKNNVANAKTCRCKCKQSIQHKNMQMPACTSSVITYRLTLHKHLHKLRSCARSITHTHSVKTLAHTQLAKLAWGKNCDRCTRTCRCAS